VEGVRGHFDASVSGEKTERRGRSYLLQPRRQFNYFTISLFHFFTGYKSNRDTRREILPSIAISAAATALSAATTAAALSAAATAAISAAATAARATGAGARLVNLNLSALEVGVIEGLDCLGRVGRLDHLDETEAARLPREFVGHDNRALDLSRLCKQLCQVFLRNRIGQVAYIQFSGHKSPPCEFAGKLLYRRPSGISTGFREKGGVQGVSIQK
jgi:hypothetical protein